MNPIQFQISDLRSKSIQTLLEMIGIVVFCIFFGAFAPSLIISMFFSEQQFLEAPWFYEAIPVGALALSILYTIYALTINFFREKQIRRLGMQLAHPEDLSIDLEEKEIEELEKMVDKTLKANRKPKVKAASRKTSKN